MKQEQENKITGSNLEISSQLRGRSMVGKNSKMKNTFHSPFLKCMHFSTTQNYLTRETKALLRETKITGSNNKKPNSFYLWHCLCSQIIFIFSGRNWGEKKRAEGKKKKKRQGDIRDKMHFRLCHIWLKWSKIQLAALEHMTLQRQAVSSITVEGNKWTTLYCSETLA